MGIHPFGPWSESADERSFLLNQGVGTIVGTDGTNVHNVASISNVFGGVAPFDGENYTKTGDNNPYNRRCSIPSSSSLISDSCTIEGRFSAHAVYKVGSTVYHSDCSNVMPFAPPFLGAADNSTLAFNAALQKMYKAHAGSLQGLVALGEFKESVGTVGHVVKQIKSLMQAKKLVVERIFKGITISRNLDAKNFQIPKWKRGRLAGNLANEWLQLQYGLLPLLSDANSALQAAAEISVQPLRQSAYHYSGRHSVDSAMSSFVQGPVSGAADFKCNTTIVTHRTDVVKVGARIRAECVNDMLKYLSSASHQLGFGIQDIAPAVWELLPYSFLIDYFVNVGDFFNALAFRRGVSEKGYKITITEIQSYLTSAPNSVTDAIKPVPVNGTSGIAQRKSVSYNRVPANVDSLIPILQFKDPTAKQGINIAALAVSHLSEFNARVTGGDLSKVIRSARAQYIHR